MKFRLDDEKKLVRAAVLSFLVVAASMLLYYCLFHGKVVVRSFRNVLKVLAPVLYGLGIAFLLTPIVRFLEEVIVGSVFRAVHREPSGGLKRLVRWVCVIFSLMLFLTVIYSVLALILPQLISSVVSLVASFPSYVEKAVAWMQAEVEKGTLINSDMVDLFNTYSSRLQEYLTNNLVPQLQNMLKNLTSGVFDVITFFKNFLVGALISLYVMADRNTFVAKAKMVTYAIFPMRWANFLIRGMRYAGKTFSGFISGKIIDSAIIAVICYAVCTFLKMPYAILVSVIIGITNIIPFFGPFLGAIPCTFLILLVNPVQSLYFLIFIFILQQFDGNILGPKILGDSTGLSSFMVIVSILVGGGFFGFMGMLLGVPTCAVLIRLSEYLTDRSLRQKALDVKVDTYYEMDHLDPVSKQALPRQEHRDVKQGKQKPRSVLSLAFMKFWDGLMLILISLIKIVWMALKYIRNQIHVWLMTNFRPSERKRRREERRMRDD